MNLYVQREPAMILMLVASLIQLVSALIFPLTEEQQGVLNALASAVVGVVVAVMVSLDKAVPLVAGLFQSAISVGLAFGMNIAPEAQSAIMAVVVAVTAFFTRQAVTAKVPAVESVGDA